MPHMFIPGPVDVAPEVLQAQTRPMLPHRSREFEALYQQAVEKTRPIFGTNGRIYITASSGTGLQEAAVRNFAQTRILSCINGAFGKRWHTVATTNGKLAEALEFEWAVPVNPSVVAEAVHRGQYEAVTIVHNETSTGMQNPVQEIAAAVHEASPQTLVCVDAVSSLGGVEIEMDTWGIDFLFTSSQKCLALPPGLGLAAVSDRALEYATQVPHRGWYFDLLRLEKHRLKDSTPATPAISLIYALDHQMDRILNEGLGKRFTRHRMLAIKVREWVLAQGFGLYASEGFQSNTVTTVINRHKLDVGALNAYLQNRGMRIANGYGPLKNETFRIAHMGETRVDDIETLLTTINEFISKH